MSWDDAEKTISAGPKSAGWYLLKWMLALIVGSQEVWGASADAWDDRFQLMAMVEEQQL